MEIRALLLEAVKLPRLQRDSLARDRERQIEQERQIRLQMAVHPAFEIGELVPVEAATSARLNLLDKQLSTPTRDVRDLRGAVTRQLLAQDAKLDAQDEKLETLNAKLDAHGAMLEAILARLPQS